MNKVYRKFKSRSFGRILLRIARFEADELLARVNNDNPYSFRFAKKFKSHTCRLVPFKHNWKAEEMANHNCSGRAYRRTKSSDAYARIAKRNYGINFTYRKKVNASYN